MLWFVCRLGSSAVGLLVCGWADGLFGGGGGSELWRRSLPWSSWCYWSISLFGACGGGEVSDFGALRRRLRFGSLA